MNKIFIASRNIGKIAEIREALKGLNIELFSLLDAPDIPETEETGSTFRENSLIKAKAVYDVIKIPVLADDSGLEVDHLNRAPGVYSARYAGENATDKQNCDKLLNELKGVEYRGAVFKCVLILYDGINERYFDGECKGKIINGPKGEKGFGYDPLFVPDGFNKTFAELDFIEKNKISHRGKAVACLKKFLNFERELGQ